MRAGLSRPSCKRWFGGEHKGNLLDPFFLQPLSLFPLNLSIMFGGALEFLRHRFVSEHEVSVARNLSFL